VEPPVDSTPTSGPTTPRWTHIALPCRNLDVTLAWYARYTSFELLDRRRDDVGQSAWIGHRDASSPFLLVLVDFDAQHDGPRQPMLRPFAHLGIELPTQAAVDAIAEQARADGCLAWEPQRLPPPVGYVCAASDPDGNVVEFSFDQGVYAAAHERWSTP
jgi:lactoylglutathione lyase